MTRILHFLRASTTFLALASCGLFVDPPAIEQTSTDASGGTGSRSTSGAIESDGGQPPADDCGSSCASSASSAGTSGSPIEVNECVNECDCDGDGYLSRGACGGDDCDDHDPKVHPGQTEYQSEPATNPAIGFDYNCSETIDRDPEQAVVDCGLLDLLLCAENQGFKDTLPACGEPAEWVRCTPAVLGLACTQESVGMVVARCR